MSEPLAQAVRKKADQKARNAAQRYYELLAERDAKKLRLTQLKVQLPKRRALAQVYTAASPTLHIPVEERVLLEEVEQEYKEYRSRLDQIEVELKEWIYDELPMLNRLDTPASLAWYINEKTQKERHFVANRNAATESDRDTAAMRKLYEKKVVPAYRELIKSGYELPGEPTGEIDCIEKMQLISGVCRTWDQYLDCSTSKHEDGPHPPRTFVYKGARIELTEYPWHMVRSVWDHWRDQGEFPEVDYVAEKVWGTGDVKDGKVRNTAWRANQKLAQLGLKMAVKNGRVTLNECDTDR